MIQRIKNSGFTLVELVVVIIIIAILAGATFYINWSPSTLTLDTNATQLINTIRYTQNVAMTRNERCSFIINTVTRSYTMQDSNSQAINIPGTTGSITLDNDISFGTLTGITNTIIFNGRGVPYSDNDPNTPITGNITVVLQAIGGQTRTITVVPNTGEVS